MQLKGAFPPEVAFPPKKNGDCEHGKWPEANKKSNKYLFDLTPLSYAGRTLLNTTVKFFWAESTLLTTQQLAKEKLVKLYKNDKARRAADKDALWEAAQAIDEFFLFGSLTRSGDDRESGPLMRLSIARTRIREGSYCIDDDPVSPFVHVVIARHTTKRKVFNLRGAIHRLIRGMVQAYLRVFLCRRDKCHRNILTNYGAAGHGPICRTLCAAIVVTMRKWDSAMETICGTEVRANGFPFRLLKWERERLQGLRRKKSKALEDLNPLRGESPLQRVRVTSEHGLEVGDRLVEDAKMYFQKQRDKCGWGEEDSDEDGDDIVEGTTVDDTAMEDTAVESSEK